MLATRSFKMKPPRSVRLNKASLYAKGFVGFWLIRGYHGLKVLDLSGTENHGVISGNVHLVFGNQGLALDFDGVADYVTLSSAKLSTTQGTLNAWVKYDRSIPAGASDDYVFSRRTTAGDSLYLSATKLDLHYVGIGDVFASTGVTLIKDSWMMLTLSWNSTHYFWYKNGAMRKTGAYGNLTTLGAVILLGGICKDDVFLANYCFDGQVSQASMYNRTMSPSEVKGLYSQSFRMFTRLDILSRLTAR